jgi:hypothetical protein
MLENWLVKADTVSYTGAGNTHTATDRAGTSSDPYLEVGNYDDIVVMGILSATSTLTSITAKLMGYTATTGGSTTTLMSATGITGTQVTTLGAPFAFELEGAKLGNFHHIAVKLVVKGTDPDGKMKTLYFLGNPRSAPVTQTAFSTTSINVG